MRPIGYLLFMLSIGFYGLLPAYAGGQLRPMLQISIKRQAPQQPIHTYSTVRHYRTDATEADQSIQQVRVLDGEPATLSLGQRDTWNGALAGGVDLDIGPRVRPQQRGNRGNRRGPRGPNRGWNQAFGEAYDLSQNRSTLNQLMILPMLQGKQVIVTVDGQWENLDRLGDAAVNSQRISTRVRIPLGKWVAIGGQRANVVSKRIKRWETEDRQLNNSVIYIKVERLD